MRERVKQLLQEQLNNKERLQQYVNAIDKALRSIVEKHPQYTDSFAYAFITNTGSIKLGGYLQGQEDKKIAEDIKHRMITYFGLKNTPFDLHFYTDEATFQFIANLKHRFMSHNKDLNVTVFPSRLEQQYSQEWEQGKKNLIELKDQIVQKYGSPLKISDAFVVADKLTFQTQLFIVSDAVASDKELNYIVYQLEKDAKKLFNKVFVEAKRSNYPLGMTIDYFGEDFTEGDHEHYVVFR